MSAIVEQRQKSPVDARQRTDGEDDGEHDERTAAECANRDVDPIEECLGRIAPRSYSDEETDICRYGAEKDGVVDDLRTIPLDSPEADAHRETSTCACGSSGGGRSQSAMLTPIPTITTRI